MKISRPRRIQVTGDLVEGKKYLGVACSQLTILENQMQFQNLKQGSRTVNYSNGMVISCWSCFDTQQVGIYYPPSGEEVEPTEKKECFANTGIAQAKVLRVVDLTEIDINEPDAPELTITDTISGVEIEPDGYPAGYYCTKDILYDLEVCGNGEEYILFENVPSTDFSPHIPDEMVLVVLSRIEIIPQEVIDDNTDYPCAIIPYPTRVIEYGENVIAILPFSTDLLKYEYSEA